MFSKLIGNDGIKLTLRRLTAAGRIPNSMLLSGDEGVGKRQFAIEIAKSIVCREPVNGEACDVCPPCRRAGSFTFAKEEKKEDFERIFFSEHPDVGTVVPYNRNILVDAIRHLESEANYRPYEAKARIFIIDEADKMNDASANALLKTLEEPPPTTYIFLVTSRPDKLLPTIRSRCQSLRFVPVSAAEIENYLITEKAFTHDEARLAARLSRGSLSRALSIQMDGIRKNRDSMMKLLTAALERRGPAAALKVTEGLNAAKDKSVFEESLDILQSLIHDVWSMRVSDGTSPVVNSDLESELQVLSRHSSNIDLPGWLDLIDSMRADLQININRKIAADALAVKMTAEVV